MDSKPVEDVRESIKALILRPKPRTSPSEVNSNREKEAKNFELIDMHFRFKIHRETKDIIVQIVDTETGEVIREFPPEKILNMISEFLKMLGLIIDKRV